MKVGEVTKAVRDATSAVGRIKKGDYLGLLDHKIKAVGSSLEETTRSLLELMVEGSQVMTILSGAEVSLEEAERLLAWVGENYPEVESELHRGEQPLYYYIIGVE